MVEAMGKLEAGDLPLTPQPEEDVLYAAKISKEETHIDFAKPARDVHNHIRGLSPFPGPGSRRRSVASWSGSRCWPLPLLPAKALRHGDR